MQKGDRVAYRAINLYISGYRGTVENTDRGKYGGDCHVKWDYSQFVSEEWSPNLIVIKEAKDADHNRPS